MQIYFDFSGYSDMAIGLGRMLGFKLPENFRRPYSSCSITDFWRRWHITLSSWFRDYVYIPMGGSRVSPCRTYFNLVFIFFVVGLWHGANYTFVLWGGYHGCLLLFERLAGRRYIDEAPHPWLNRFVTFFLVMLGWVLFRSEDLTQSLVFYKQMFIFDGEGIPVQMLLAMTTKNKTIFMLSLLCMFLPRSFNFGIEIAYSPKPVLSVVRLLIIFMGLPYAALLIVNGTFSPFLYFQF